MRQKFIMDPHFVKVRLATERNKKALECVIKAIEQYDAACAKASETLSSNLQKCKLKLQESEPPESIEKK